MTTECTVCGPILLIRNGPSAQASTTGKQQRGEAPLDWKGTPQALTPFNRPTLPEEIGFEYLLEKILKCL